MSDRRRRTRQRSAVATLRPCACCLDSVPVHTPPASSRRRRPGGPVRPPGRRRWLRANFVSTLDGAATGADGRSGSINTEADHVVFAPAAAAERRGRRRRGHRARRGLPGAWRAEDGRGAAAGRGQQQRPYAGCAARARARPWPRASDHPRGRPTGPLAEAREALGEEAVLVCGESAVDLVAARAALEARGLSRILAEGGPSLLGAMLEPGVVDELDLSWSPRLVGGDGPRIVSGRGPRHGAGPDGDGGVGGHCPGALAAPAVGRSCGSGASCGRAG